MPSLPLHTRRLLPLLLTGALWPGHALAAPFCVEIQGIPPQCYYYDAVECRTRAADLGGVCTANPLEFIVTPGNGKFCLTDSNRATRCLYPDRESCDTDARREGGVCLDSTPIGVQRDPYQLDPNRKY